MHLLVLNLIVKLGVSVIQILSSGLVKQGFPNLCSRVPFGHLSIRSCTPKILTYYSEKKTTSFITPKPRLKTKNKKGLLRNLNGILSPNLHKMVSKRLPYNLSMSGGNVPLKMWKCPPGVHHVPRFGNPCCKVNESQLLCGFRRECNF